MRITKAKALHIMRPVEGEQRFFCANGDVWGSLTECSRYVQNISQEAFHHHCNIERCDFSSWIKDVLGDEKLATDIQKCKGVRACVEKALMNRTAQLAKYHQA